MFFTMLFLNAPLQCHLPFYQCNCEVAGYEVMKAESSVTQLLLINTNTCLYQEHKHGILHVGGSQWISQIK